MSPTRAARHPMPRVGLSAVAWCCVFAVAHVYWALGGSAGLASSAGADLAARRPTVFVVLGLWGLAGLLLLAAVGIVVVGTRQHPSLVARIEAWTIGVIGSGLLLRGIGLEVLLAGDVDGIRSAIGPLETRWSLLLWNPWFSLGGALFLATASRLLRRTRSASSSR